MQHVPKHPVQVMSRALPFAQTPLPPNLLTTPSFLQQEGVAKWDDDDDEGDDINIDFVV